MPLEGDWQRAELARSVTLPILRWPNAPVQRSIRRLLVKDVGKASRLR